MTGFSLKSVSLFWLIIFYSFFSQTHAHLIDDNSGTLNITDDGAYLVISLPTEFFRAINKAVSYTHLTLPTKRIV